MDLEKAAAMLLSADGVHGAGDGKEGGTGTPQIAAADEAPPAIRARPPRLALPEMDSATKVLLQQIQEHVAKDPAFAAGVIRGWMEEE
jgi:hypothetical protein